MAAEITAVILAGGVGKRFTPFVTDKTLFPFMGRSLIERTIQMVQDAGITSVIIAANHYNQEWIETAAEKFPSLNIVHKVQAHPAGMGDALLSLTDVLPERDIIVMNAGDMVEDKLLRELLAFIPGRQTVLTGRRINTYQPLGYFSFNPDGRVSGIVEKPGEDNMPSDLSNLVFHYFSDAKQFINLVNLAQKRAAADQDDVYEQALDELIKQGQVEVYQYEGAWQKLKFGFHVLEMSEFFLNQLERFISPDAIIAETATINGEVVIEAGARILDGAIVQGPCWIGRNAVIGNNALVRQSIVEEGVVIGFSSEIVRSYVGAHSDLHHAYVGDSVLEADIHFGYNAHTANFRFDHQQIDMKWLTGKTPTNRHKLGSLIATGTEIGSNATILPGICLGFQSIVYPACVVFEPVPDRSVVKEKRQQEIEKRV